MSYPSGRNIFRTETNRLVVFFKMAVGVMRRPAFFILEKPYGSDLACATQIEPMASSTRDPDHISRANFNGNGRMISRRNVKQAASANREAHFVFIMPVFAVESGQHLIQSGSKGVDVDNVNTGISSLLFYTLDLLRISRENRRSIVQISEFH